MTIGSNVKVQNNVNVYAGVTMEDDVFLGPSMTFTDDLYPRAFNRDWQISPIHVKKGASICTCAVIVCGVTIGEFAMIGADTVVTKDVPPYTLSLGNPAQIIGRVCRCGRRLNKNSICPVCNNDTEGK